MRTIASIATVVIGIFSVGALAETKTTPVSGTFNNSQENACIHITRYRHLADCSFGRVVKEVAGESLLWTGPTVNPVYYVPGSEHAVPTYAPVLGDDRISPSMDGTLTINDQGTDDPSDDTISGRLTVGPAARSVVVSVNELAGGPSSDQPRAVLSWSSTDHTMAPTQVDAAASNAQGGFDYVIASKSFPSLICRTEDPDDCYPSARAGLTRDGQQAAGIWLRPGSAGVTRDTAMAGNVGATTTAMMSGYQCTDNRGGIGCVDHNVVWKNSAKELPPGTRGTEDPGLDNLLLKVSTDATGRVLRAAGFWTQEYYIKAGPQTFQVPEGHDNSWQGGYMQLTGSAEATTTGD